MNGQGSPSSELARPTRRRNSLSQFLLGLLFVGCCAQLDEKLCHAQPSSSPRIDMRVQIAWGGADAKLWRGTIEVPGGELSNLRLLGLDSDQPGSFVNEGSRLRIEPRYANHYSGIEVTISAPADGNLVLRLQLGSDSDDPEGIPIPLAELVSGSIIKPLLGETHQVRVARVAGDQLRVRLNRKTMVFAPEERVVLDVDPHLLNARPDSVLRARLRLRRRGDRRNDVADFLIKNDDVLWNHTETVKVGQDGNAPPLTNLEIPVPDEEGVYDLLIDLAHRLPQVGSRLVARRNLQFVVIEGRRPQLQGSSESTLVTEFDPADPSWFERLSLLPQWRILPLTQRGPWTNQSPAISKIDDRVWTRLDQEGWIAYSLPISEVGQPHILDIEFPAKFGQDVGVSILDGDQEIVSLDSGVAIGDQDLLLPGVSGYSKPTHHRLVFWPTTSSPSVLISNRSEGEVVFGRIRLESYPGGLPVAESPTPNGRKRIAVVDGNRLKEIFFARTAFNKETEISFDDWQTFYDVGIRLVEYLKYAGYDGATVSAAADGSSIFPSEILYPTPSYDRGSFSGLGQDPYRKDVVEMLLRLFDREGLQLIPAIEFATPLPELEQLLAAGPDTSDGIELKDHFGRMGGDLQKQYTGRAPYYNPLDPRVQAAMQHVVQELTERYSKHPSFAGLQINCSDVGFTQLPDAGWGFDSTTLATFIRETGTGGTTVAAMDKTMVLLRDQLRTRESTPLTDAWLKWRAAKIGALYKRLAGVLSESKSQDAPDVDRLYVSMVDLPKTSPWQRNLRPALPRTTSVDAALLELGLDLSALRAIPNVDILRPQRLSTLSHLASQAVNLEVFGNDIQQFFGEAASGSSQYLYEPRTSTLADFDKLGPPIAKGRTILESFPCYPGHEARHPYARGLAQHDDLAIFSGGDSLPLGQELAIQSFFSVYRQLPNVPFEEVEFENASPLVIRKAVVGEETWVYVVNVSPWSAETNLNWKIPPQCFVSAIGKKMEGQPMNKTGADVTIEPYGLLALRFSSPKVELLGCIGTIRETTDVSEQLRIQVEQIVSRHEQIQRKEIPDPIPLVRDPGFESEIGINADTPWQVQAVVPGDVGNDYQMRAQGNSSLHMRATKSIVSVASNDFLAPKTGRLVVALKLRTSKPMRVPLLLRLQTSDPEYQPIHRFEPMTTEFREIALRFSDLPTDPNLRIRIQLELDGPGEVWIDDVQLYDRWFINDEHKELQRILHAAFNQHMHGQFGKCYETLSGYWPRFLLRHVPPVEVASRPVQRLPEVPAQEKPDRPRLIDRMKKYIHRFKPY